MDFAESTFSHAMRMECLVTYEISMREKYISLLCSRPAGLGGQVAGIFWKCVQCNEEFASVFLSSLLFTQLTGEWSLQQCNNTVVLLIMSALRIL